MIPIEILLIYGVAAVVYAGACALDERQRRKERERRSAEVRARISEKILRDLETWPAPE